MQPFSTAIINKIHPYALGKINEQMNKLAQPQTLLVCSHTFHTVMGLSCAHELLEICKQHSYICLERIHGHWHYNRTVTATIQDPSIPPPILNPITIQPRGRLRGALNWRQNPSTNERDNQLGMVYRGSGRRNKRRGGRKARAGAGSQGTRREPKGFKIVNNKLPSSM